MKASFVATVMTFAAAGHIRDADVPRRAAIEGPALRFLRDVRRGAPS